MAKLIFTDRNHAGRVYEFVLEKTTVGRSDQNTLVISDGSLSAVHCEILLNGPEVIVRDLGSRNGTFVNGVKLTNQQSQLKSGQVVRFGSVEARLELDNPPSDDTLSDITAVHSLGRIMREQKREREKPKPANAAMKLESSDSSADADRTASTLTTPQPTEHSIPAAAAPAGNQSGKLSRKAVIAIAVFVLGLIVLLWLWWGRK